MRFPSGRTLDDQLRVIENRIRTAQNASRDDRRPAEDRESFRRFVDHWLERWLQVHDLRVVIELDRMLKRRSRDVS